jgi:serine/threonine protein kinase
MLRDYVENEINVMRDMAYVDQFVKYIDSFNTQDYIYMVMDYCNGGDLETFSKKFGPLSEGTIRYIYSQLFHGI